MQVNSLPFMFFLFFFRNASLITTFLGEQPATRAAGRDAELPAVSSLRVPRARGGARLLPPRAALPRVPHPQPAPPPHHRPARRLPRRVCGRPRVRRGANNNAFAPLLFFLFHVSHPAPHDALPLHSPQRLELFLPDVDLIAIGDATSELLFLATGEAALLAEADPDGERDGATAELGGGLGASAYEQSVHKGGLLGLPTPRPSGPKPAGSATVSAVYPRAGASAGAGAAMTKIGTLYPGGTAGEVPFLFHLPQPYTVRTTQLCRVLSLRHAAWDSACSAHPRDGAWRVGVAREGRRAHRSPRLTFAAPRPSFSRPRRRRRRLRRAVRRGFFFRRAGDAARCAGTARSRSRSRSERKVGGAHLRSLPRRRPGRRAVASQGHRGGRERVQRRLRRAERAARRVGARRGGVRAIPHRPRGGRERHRQRARRVLCCVVCFCQYRVLTLSLGVLPFHSVWQLPAV